MDTKRREKEEYLEKLWEMQEQRLSTVDDLELTMSSTFDAGLVDGLALDGLVKLAQDNGKITLTGAGEKQARQIIRAHRLGERLIYDIFGGDFEKGACEFEHTNTVQIIDGICTLLGHPRDCPHGLPIPEGECCRNSVKMAPNLVNPVTEMEIGQSARIAYINSADDRQMHRLNGQQIRPGTVIKLHQKYPCFVVECENANIALDEEIVSNICVWSNAPQMLPPRKKLKAVGKKPGSWWSRCLGLGNKKECGCAD